MQGISDDLQAVKMRQDLVFKKQDMIQLTLAGEIPTGHSCYRSGSHSFCPPSAGPSVVAWSPPFPSAQIQQRQPQTAFSQATYCPSCSTPVNSIIDLDSFSNEDIQSFLSLDLDGGQSKGVRNTDPLPLVDTPSSLPLQTQYASPLPYSDGTPLPTL